MSVEQPRESMAAAERRYGTVQMESGARTGSRVRAAALRALAKVGEAEHAVAIRGALDDHERRVAAAADTTLCALSVRLDQTSGDAARSEVPAGRVSMSA